MPLPDKIAAPSPRIVADRVFRGALPVEGERKAIVEAEDWEGPDFKTCANAAWVCRAYQDHSRRREQLSFNHHAEVAALPPDEADAPLDWCEETSETGRELWRRYHIAGICLSRHI